MAIIRDLAAALINATNSSKMSVTTDQLEFGRLLLAVALVVVNVGVWLGVFLENERFSEPMKKAGWNTLVVALAAEALFAAILVGIDSTISARQKAEIVALEAQIAPRRIPPDACGEMAAALASLSGNVKIVSYAADLEGGLLAWQVANCFAASKTLKVVRAFASVMPLGGFGVGVFVSGPDEKLVAAIRFNLTEKAKLFVGEGNGFFMGNMSMGPSTDVADAVTVLIATRPHPDMIHE